MKLNDTVAMMNSEDFKDRMRAEYHQLVNRADSTFRYVAGVDLTASYGVPTYGEGPLGV